MDGGYTSIWLKEPLTPNQKEVLHQYERYLSALSPDSIKSYSFWWKSRHPTEFTNYEQRQFKQYLESEIKEEISICGLAEPLFRAVEAMLKYFGGYYIHTIDKVAKQYLRGEYYAIKRRNTLGIPLYYYHILDWEFVASYFNRKDDEQTRNLYSIELFCKNIYLNKLKTGAQYGKRFN